MSLSDWWFVTKSIWYAIAIFAVVFVVSSLAFGGF